MSTITLYKNCKIVPEKNFLVDDVATYLSSLTNFPISDFQYQKIDVDMSIKVEMNQEVLSEDELYNYNYCSILQDSKTYYFFIMNKSWIAKKTVEFKLSIDSINTFKLNTDYELTNNTHIVREHKDRFKYGDYELILGSPESMVDNVRYVIKDTRNILATVQPAHNYAGIMKIYIYDNSTNELLEEYPLRHYSISCILHTYDPSPDYGDPVQGNQGTYTISDYDSPEVYGSYEYSQTNLRIEIQGTNYEYNYLGSIFGRYQKILRRIVDRTSEGIGSVLFGEDKETLYVPDEANKWYLIYRSSNEYSESNPQSVDVILTSDSNEEIRAISAYATIDVSDLEDGHLYFIGFPVKESPNSFPNEITQLTGTEEFTLYDDQQYEYKIGVYLKKEKNNGKKIFRQRALYFWKENNKIVWQIDQLDRSNNILVRVNSGESTSLSVNVPKLQYFSDDFETVYQADGTETTVSLKPFNNLNRTDTKLIKIIELPYAPLNIAEGEATTDGYFKLKTYSNGFKTNKVFETSEWNPFQDLYVYETPSLTQLRDIERESKLYHSDYYQAKFVYDSFAFTFQNEFINDTNPASDQLSVDYIVSNTSSSKLAFGFNDYEPDTLTENYPILTVNRSLEVPIFNSNYFNYLKYGYNAEVKDKNANLTKNYILAGASTAGTIVSIATSAATGGVSVAAAIALGASAISLWTNAIVGNVQADRNLTQKINDLRNQGSSISGSDDIDIFDWYSDNKAKLMLWQTSKSVKQALYNMFFFTGYKCDYNDIPNMNNRVRFNFIQCEADFGDCSLSKKYKDDLSARYHAGVTVLHKVNDNWDWEQQYENWESNLF